MSAVNKGREIASISGGKQASKDEAVPANEDRDDREAQDGPQTRDKDLVAACQAGDKEAFRVLFQRYHRRAYSLAFGVVRDADQALDVVQDAFVKAYRHIGNFQGTASFYTWLYRIVMNVAIDHIRKRKRNAAVDYDDGIAHTEEDAPVGMEALSPQILRGDPRKEIARREIRDQIQAALAKLSPTHRAVLVMREVDGMSYQQMAQIVKCSKGTIMSRLFHARRYMQKHLLEMMNADDDAESEN